MKNFDDPIIVQLIQKLIDSQYYKLEEEYFKKFQKHQAEMSLRGVQRSGSNIQGVIKIIKEELDLRAEFIFNNLKKIFNIVRIPDRGNLLVEMKQYFMEKMKFEEAQFLKRVKEVSINAGLKHGNSDIEITRQVDMLINKYHGEIELFLIELANKNKNVNNSDSRSIVGDATMVLLYLANYEKEPGDIQKGHYQFEASELAEGISIEPNRLNDAVDLLEENNYAEVTRTIGTAPFMFHWITLTTRGRIEAERLSNIKKTDIQKQDQNPQLVEPIISRSPTPVGSPYGFTLQDWESVSIDREDATRLIVVFGHQWESKHFKSETIRENIKNMFESSLKAVEKKLVGGTVRLDYRPLRGGYGGHLFNQIARDIIGADIAVFETSDHNPNVMIELGVALTWGIRVLPIKNKNAQTVPNDISGQTYAEYSEDGKTWVDPEHGIKLEKMIEMVMKRKPGKQN